MPAELERRLKEQAKRKGIKDPGAYVYGTMRKTGWTPSTQEKSEHQEAAKRRLKVGHVRRFK